jgi:hypothetical protein
MNDVLALADNLVKQYSYPFTFVSFVVGIVGIMIGLFARWRLREVVQLRERVISSHLQNMRSFKKNTLGKSGDGLVKDQFLAVYNGLLTMISIVINPSEQELQGWLESGRIDKDDYNELFRLKWRK